MTSLNEWIDVKIKDGDIKYFEYNDFSKVKNVGKGAFGIINKAYWKSCGIEIALKKLIADNSSISEDNMNTFLKEVRIYIIFYSFLKVLITITAVAYANSKHDNNFYFYYKVK